MQSGQWSAAASVGVEVRDLDDGEERQQDKTQDRHHRPSDWTLRGDSLRNCDWNPVKLPIPSLKDTQYWTHRRPEMVAASLDGLGGERTANASVRWFV